MPAPEDAPYVGPRPFDRAERGRFYGRDQEARTLESLIVAHRVVLLYAASGAGKTSLLNAGVVPLLEDEDDFEVLPPVRLQGVVAPEAGGNPYIANLLANLARGLGEEQSTEPTLAAFLAGRPHLGADDDLPSPRALIIDQFEELFTLYPEHWPQRTEVFDQLREALEQDPLLRLVLAIREDFIAQLDPYAALLPTRLRTRMRLESLRRPPALAAIAMPLAGASRTFAPGVAEHLVDDLLKVRIHTLRDDSIEVPGELVEPVQLQVVCRTLWSSLPADVEEIGEADLARIGSVSDVLSTYYSEAVRAAAAAGGIAEHDLRERLETAFITPVGTRGTVVGAGEEIAGIPAAAINELEARHLVRAEWRAGARWFELTHDSLIRPIVSSNAKLREERQRRRERRLTRAVAGLVAVAGILVAFLVFGRDEEPAGQAAKAPTVGVVKANAPLAGLRLTRELRASAPPVAMSTTAGGRGLLLAGTDGRIRLWDVNLGREIKTLDYGTTGISSVDFADDTIIAAGALGLKRWDAEGLGTLPPDEVSVEDAGDQATSDSRTPATEVAVSPNAFSVLVVRDGRGGFDGSLADEKPMFSRSLISIGYSPSGTAALGVAVDGTVRLRHLASDDEYLGSVPTGRELTLQAPGKFVSAAFSTTGGRVVTASGDGTARVWRTEDGAPLKAIATGRAPLTDARLSPNGQLVATVGRDGMLRVFSIAGDRVAVIRASLRPLTAVTWSADGQLLATAGEDAIVRVWTNVAAQRPLTGRECSDAQFLLPAAGRANTARGSGRRAYIGSVSCRAREGEAVRAPEAGTLTSDCGPITASRVAMRGAGGRCWVFFGVAPRSRSGGVDAGATIGDVVRRAAKVYIELWERPDRGRHVADLWNPMLFLDVEAAKAPRYPGEKAGQEAIAKWMGTTAEEAGLPAELPVMASLADSGLRNLKYGDADSVGYFAMRVGIWDQGEYAGFPERPDLQLKWFVDQAKVVRAQMHATGRDPFGRPEKYGRWIADVMRPAEQFRGRYQLRLSDAQRLLDQPVTQDAKPPPVAPDPGPEPAAVPAVAAPEPADAAPVEAVEAVPTEDP